jgi:anti-sigma factor ChrR (cupin superfamily)
MGGTIIVKKAVKCAVIKILTDIMSSSDNSTAYSIKPRECHFVVSQSDTHVLPSVRWTTEGFSMETINRDDNCQVFLLRISQSVYQ